MSSSEPHSQFPGQTDKGLAPSEGGTVDDGAIEQPRETRTSPTERPSYDDSPERPSLEEGDVERPHEHDDAEVDLGEEVGEPVEIGPDERGEPDPRRDD